MACAKPPNTSHASRPTPHRHPTVESARAFLRQIASMLGNLSPGKELDRQMERARRAVDRARNAGIYGQLLRSLEGQLGDLRGQAKGRQRSSVIGPATPLRRSERPPKPVEVSAHWSAKSAERVAPTVQRALTDKSHWQHQEITDQLAKYVRGNETISGEYKEQLSRDIAEVLRVTPNALGLVKEATLRGQRKPLASKGKMGTGTGTAYEIMGTAALIRKGSKAKNTGTLLTISPGDRVDFGEKIFLNREKKQSGEMELRAPRKTIENDTSLWKMDEGREIGIDFKHVKGGGSYGDKGELKGQVDNVVRAIRHGQIHEYHFVTNGHFSTGKIKADGTKTAGFMGVIEAANKELAEAGCLAQISCHEHVTTV